MIHTAFDIRAGAGVYEAGFVQRREWMLYKIREDHYPLSVLVDFQLPGFDHHLFQQTIGLLVEKHEILRTTLAVRDGILKQIIHDPADVPARFDYLDLSSMSAGQRGALLREQTMYLSYLPFNFEYGPLFRISAFKVSENHFEVVCIFHHLIFDKHSTDIFKSDASLIWSRLAQGEQYIPYKEQKQYKNYTALENDLLNTQLGESYRSYWSAQIEQGMPRLLLAPFHTWNAYQDRNIKKIEEVRKRMSTLPVYDRRFTGSVARRYRFNRAGMIDLNYSEDTFRRMVIYKKERNSNLHSLFIASFLLALHQLSGQKLFVFDIPAARKTDGDYKNMIGWLASGGICYFNMEENRDAAAFLRYIDRQLSFLAKYCIYPFEVMDYSSELPLGSTIPVFFTLSESEHNLGQDPPAGVVNHAYEGPAVYEDLSIFLNLHGNCGSLRLYYNNSLLSPDVIEKLVTTQERSLDHMLKELL